MLYDQRFIFSNRWLLVSCLDDVLSWFYIRLFLFFSRNFRREFGWKISFRFLLIILRWSLIYLYFLMYQRRLCVLNSWTQIFWMQINFLRWALIRLYWNRKIAIRLILLSANYGIGRHVIFLRYLHLLSFLNNIVFFIKSFGWFN